MQDLQPQNRASIQFCCTEINHNCSDRSEPSGYTERSLVQRWCIHQEYYLSGGNISQPEDFPYCKARLITTRALAVLALSSVGTVTVREVQLLPCARSVTKSPPLFSLCSAVQSTHWNWAFREETMLYGIKITWTNCRELVFECLCHAALRCWERCADAALVHSALEEMQWVSTPWYITKYRCNSSCTCTAGHPTFGYLLTQITCCSAVFTSTSFDCSFFSLV